MPGPVGIKKVGADRYDVHVFPRNAKDKIMYSDRKDYLRVKGEPRQANPLERPGGVIGVLGAGNFSSSFEVITGLFLDNCTVVHKPHPMNEKSNAVWEKIMRPLVDHKALSFCDPDDGKDLVQDGRLTRTYFTGGAPTARAISASTDTPIVSEYGGNNPCIIVPGDRPWKASEIKHHAAVIATMGKLNQILALLRLPPDIRDHLLNSRGAENERVLTELSLRPLLRHQGPAISRRPRKAGNAAQPTQAPARYVPSPSSGTESSTV